MKTYNTLKDLLTPYGEDIAPRYFGKMLYKNTGCGPWTSFIVEESPEVLHKYRVVIQVDSSGRLYSESSLSADQWQLLGFDDLCVFALAEQDWSMKEYVDLLKKYASRSQNQELRIYAWFLSNEVLTLILHVTYPAKKFSVYYEDEMAWEGGDWENHCTGIKIGSIVEGSDVCVDPWVLLFPFTSDDLDEAVQSINTEADFYWKRDNYRWFRLVTDKDTYYLQVTWEGVEWAMKPNLTDQEITLIEEAALNYDGGEGLVDALDIPNIELYLYVNDTTY